MNRDIYDASMIYVSWMYVGDVFYVEGFKTYILLIETAY